MQLLEMPELYFKKFRIGRLNVNMLTEVCGILSRLT